MRRHWRFLQPPSPGSPPSPVVRQFLFRGRLRWCTYNGPSLQSCTATQGGPCGDCIPYGVSLYGWRVPNNSDATIFETMVHSVAAPLYKGNLVYEVTEVRFYLFTRLISPLILQDVRLCLMSSLSFRRKPCIQGFEIV